MVKPASICNASLLCPLLYRDDNDGCRAYQELETVDVVVHDSAMYSAGQRTLVLIEGSTEYSK